MTDIIVGLFILFWLIVVPFIVATFFTYKFSPITFYKNFFDYFITFIIWVGVGIIMVLVGIAVCSVCGLAAFENNSLFNGDDQHFELNGVNYTFVNQRYIDVIIPDNFTGRVSILNTETKTSLFSVSISKQEVFSKTTNVNKKYRFDTGYTGINQVTVEVETVDKFESHVYTLKHYIVRKEGSGIGAENKNAIKIEA